MSPDTVLPWLAAQGATFVLLRPRDKRPCYKGWTNAPASLAEAERHVAAGGNVGVLVGEPSGGIICLDADRDFPLIGALLPALRGACVVRPNAPQRGKFLLRVPEPLRNRVWRRAGKRKPVLELLAQRKLAVVPPSVHPSGAPYLLQGDCIPALAPAALPVIWEVLTAATLLAPPAPVLPKAFLGGEGSTARAAPSLNTLKRQWPSALHVFQHFGVTGHTIHAGPHDLRLLGNGGLLVGRPDSAHAWRWYCFADEMGGDQVDAAGYCLFGTCWNRYDATQFRAVLQALME